MTNLSLSSKLDYWFHLKVYIGALYIGKNELIYKTETEFTYVENKFMVNKRERVRRINWETGIDIETLLYKYW